MPPPTSGAPRDLAELLPDADDEAADDGAGDRGEAAEDQHRQRLERHDRQRELDAERAPQMTPGRAPRCRPPNHTIAQILLSEMPTDRAA